MSELDIRATERARPLALEVALVASLWLVLGTWIGSWLTFGLVIAPAAFQVLPSTEIAGNLIRPVLTALHLYGAAAGLVLAGLAAWLGRGWTQVILPLVLTAACLYNQFGVSAEMTEIRDLALGPEGSEAATVRYNALHERSMSIFVAVGIATLVLLGLHARDDVGPPTRQPR